MPVLAVNKRASYDYELQREFEAGLVLEGHEVKSIKAGHMSLKGAFVTVHNNELYLINALVPPYQHADQKSIKNYEPTRSRKLLLHKSEIKHIIGKKQVEGLTIVPLRVYTKKSQIKLSFAIGRGKKEYDKRQSIAKRDSDRRTRRLLKR